MHGIKFKDIKHKSFFFKNLLLRGIGELLLKEKYEKLGLILLGSAPGVWHLWSASAFNF